jgi:hypothetical protein
VARAHSNVHLVPCAGIELLVFFGGRDDDPLDNLILMGDPALVERSAYLPITGNVLMFCLRAGQIIDFASSGITVAESIQAVMR